VALTRASERLVLVAARNKRGRSPWLEALSSWGYDASEPPADGETLAGGLVRHRLVRPAPIERRRPPEIERAEPARAIAAYGSAVERLEEEAARRALSRASPEFEEEQPGEEAEPHRLREADSRERPEARAVGAAVHRALERWDPSKGSLFLEELGAIARPIAQALGADPVEVEREAERVLRRFLDSPQGAKLREVEILARELPVVLAEPEGKTWTGRCDLLYRDRDGRHVVADYKTDETDDDEGLSKRYGNQLAVYARAVERALGLPAPPRAELWLLRSGRIVEVPLRPERDSRP
jgi:ATP-dependent exoDNAse (exonuclease V) beta subunit